MRRVHCQFAVASMVVSSNPINKRSGRVRTMNQEVVGQSMGAIEGLSHITFIVRDLDCMEKILTTVLDARRVYDSGSETFSLSKERFFLIGDLWIATMEGKALPDRTYNHIAFKIDDASYDSCLGKIRSLGLELREDR